MVDPPLGSWTIDVARAVSSVVWGPLSRETGSVESTPYTASSSREAFSGTVVDSSGCKKVSALGGATVAILNSSTVPVLNSPVTRPVTVSKVSHNVSPLGIPMVSAHDSSKTEDCEDEHS